MIVSNPLIVLCANFTVVSCSVQGRISALLPVYLCSGKVGIVGDEQGVAGKGGGTDDGVGEFQPMVAAQVKGQFKQAAIVIGQCHDFDLLAKNGEAGTVTASKARQRRGARGVR